MADEGDGDERDSIWSVARGAISLYFALFSIQLVLGVGLLIWKGEPTNGDWASRALHTWQGVAPIAIASAASSVFFIEVGRGLMVMASWLEAKLKQRQERRLAEARAETNAKWRAWYERMLEAQAKDDPFDEPPPIVEDTNGKRPRS